MSGFGHPDPLIDSWLSDGPNVLSSPAREAVSKAIRVTHQRRALVLWLPDLGKRRALAVAGVVLAAVLTIALATGSRLLAPVPSSTAAPPSSPDSVQPSTLPSADQAVGSVTIKRPWVILSFEYRIPSGLELARGRESSSGEAGYAWFANMGAAYNPTGRGVVVEEVTYAKAHYSGGTFLGTDAEDFLAGMAASDAFAIGDVSATTLDGRSAWSASVTSGHFDISPGSLAAMSVHFDLPSRIIVADVDGAIVMVQIWAGSDEDLEAWLPEALLFVNSMRFRVERAPSASSGIGG